MFESIAFKNGVGPSRLLDIGAIAEALIFYERVVIVGNNATLKDLLTQIPPFIVLTLLRSGRLEFHYLKDQIGVSTNQTPGAQAIHGLVTFSSPDTSLENFASKTFVATAGNTSQARLQSGKFADLLKTISHIDFDQPAVQQTFSDNEGMSRAVTGILKTLTPDYQQDETIRFVKTEQELGRFSIETNIDFNAVNDIYHQSVPIYHSSVSEAYLLALLQGVYEASYFAATLNSEIAVNAVERSVQIGAIESAIRRSTQSENQISRFVDLTLDNAFSIREAVNGGQVQFSKLLSLLDRADKFRGWLKAQNPDANLLRAYHDEILKKTWAERLPAKTTRWGIFTGLGLGVDAMGAGGTGTAAGVALSAIDEFLFDKLLGGWKPHHFVEGELRPVLNQAKKSGP